MPWEPLAMDGTSATTVTPTSRLASLSVPQLICLPAQDRDPKIEPSLADALLASTEGSPLRAALTPILRDLNA